MARVTRSNPKAFKELEAHLKELEEYQAKSGWFESSVYENGFPVAANAAVHELGATINHPGGTPYMIGPGGKAVFVSKAAGAGLPVTKPHTIVIPPRPFMRPTIAREQTKWMKIMSEGAKLVLKGKRTARDIMDLVSATAAGDIAKTISQITSPALQASTIAARRRKMADSKTTGNLDKPLVARGLMLNSCTNVVEKAS